MGSAFSEANHTYTEIGEYTIKITGVGSNGCENEVTYKVINDSNPAAGLVNPGGTKNQCTTIPDSGSPKSELTFGITGFEYNSLETTYEIDFGDGTPIEILTQLQLLNYQQQQLIDPDFKIPELTHRFEKGSCSENNNEFIITLYVKNACDVTTNTTDSIVILGESEVEFDVMATSCVNKPVFFDNKSIIGDGLNCNKIADVIWRFGDDVNDDRRTFYSVSTAEDITHTFTKPGTYNVTLSIETECGIKEFSKEICIEPIITPTFTLNNDEGCIPFGVEATNTTDESDLCSESTYEWTVAYAADNCGNSLDWEFENGTDKNSENPKFLFKNPGKYTLTQKITTDCGTEITSKTIDVKKPPTVSINPINNFCQPGSINPTAIIENCTDNAAGITYNWMFPGGTPSSSTLENPENISYNTPGIYTITLEVTNECGTSNTAIQKFEVLEKPVLTNLITTQEICSNQSTIASPFNFK
jgi:PKD repeat protein